MVTAVPPVGLIDPSLVILISSGAPAFTVEVLTGAVVAESMVVSAWRGMAAIAARQVDASRVLRMKFLLCSVGERPPGTIARRSGGGAALENNRAVGGRIGRTEIESPV